MAKICTWNGIEYPSIKAAASACGVTTQAMSLRILKHQTCDADINAGNKRRSTSCEWEGVDYVSVRDAAITTGIPYHNLARWIRRGFTKRSEVKRARYTRAMDIRLD